MGHSGGTPGGPRGDSLSNSQLNLEGISFGVGTPWRIPGGSGRKWGPLEVSWGDSSGGG